jgi:hypothetical protein
VQIGMVVSDDENAHVQAALPSFDAMTMS